MLVVLVPIDERFAFPLAELRRMSAACLAVYVSTHPLTAIPLATLKSDFAAMRFVTVVEKFWSSPSAAASSLRVFSAAGALSTRSATFDSTEGITQPLTEFITPRFLLPELIMSPVLLFILNRLALPEPIAAAKATDA